MDVELYAHTAKQHMDSATVLQKCRIIQNIALLFYILQSTSVEVSKTIFFCSWQFCIYFGFKKRCWHLNNRFVNASIKEVLDFAVKEPKSTGRQYGWQRLANFSLKKTLGIERDILN